MDLWRTVSLLGAAVALLAAPLPCRAQFIKAPPAGTFQMKADLAGKHPRLYFTTADIADLRAKALGSRKFYLDRAKSAFGGYKGKTATFTGDWKDYLYGFWGQFAMDMLFLVDQDQAWADTAKSWALTAARTQTTWLADDLIPMDITSGMALTYDILYDQFTDPEKAELKKALHDSADFIYAKFFLDQYWTDDFQNNHLHNRIHGMAHAAFATYGDDPAWDMQKYADLAVSTFRSVAQWLPEDGSDHEGPGYWDYSYHWVVRTGHLVEHVTGADPTLGKEHFKEDLYYRIYLIAPGWKSTLGIGDSGTDAPSNMEAIARPIAQYQDAHGASVLRTLMQKVPDGFYQQPAWGLLWYDGDMADQPYSELPLWRFWPDLEAFSVRSGWDDDATAFVFKCGPPGGNKMQEERQPDWFNVAHDHPDQEHFLLFAHGVMLAEDDGYPKDQKLTRSHNSLLVDGAGQTREGEAWYQPFAYDKTGHLADVFLTESSAYATGDASKLYVGASKVVRHVMFVEGGYLMLVDDLASADANAHDFEWRLHKTGTWTGAAGQYSVADTTGAAALDIRFLQPTGADLVTALLPAELTAAPCLSAKAHGQTGRFVSVLVPQKSGSPAIASESVTATGGTAVKAVNGTTTDLFGVADAVGALSFADVEASGAAALARRTDGALALAMAVRATSLKVGGRTVLASDVPANLAWRPTALGGRFDAEAAYQTTAGSATLQLGGLRANHRYQVTLDGTPGTSPTDASAQGVASISLSLAARRNGLLTDDGLIPGQTEVDAGTATSAADGGHATGTRSGCGCGSSGAAAAGTALAALLLGILAWSGRRLSGSAATRAAAPRPRRWRAGSA